MSRARKEAGFSLVEVLVALAVLALILSPLLGAFSQAARLEAAATARNAWADEARSILDLGVAAPSAATRAGQLSDGTPYRLDIADATPGEVLRKVPVGLYRVQLTVGQPDDPVAVYTTYGLSGGAP